MKLNVLEKNQMKLKYRDGIVKNKFIKKMIKKQQLKELEPNLT